MNGWVPRSVLWWSLRRAVLAFAGLLGMGVLAWGLQSALGLSSGTTGLRGLLPFGATTLPVVLALALVIGLVEAAALRRWSASLPVAALVTGLVGGAAAALAMTWLAPDRLLAVVGAVVVGSGCGVISAVGTWADGRRLDPDVAPLEVVGI
ncbi:hypothetical protein [Oryzobacter terrae]|uniref:hypothetical protein n=1 Tax=Oryzobacter terrae TaxID=1620385 RepID=UPI00367112FC